MKLLLTLGVFGAVASLAVAQPDEEGLNSLEVFPRAASLKRGEVNVRSGPGTQYPVLWVYWRVGYPVAVLARFDNYLKIRDLEGEEGWVHQAMLGKRPTALVVSPEPALLLSKPDSTSQAVARLATGVVVALKEPCGTLYCDVEVVGGSYEGFIRPTELDAPEASVLAPAPQ